LKTAYLNLDGRKRASLLLIPLFLIVIGVLAVLNIPGSLEDPFALALLNTIFLGIIPIVVAYLSYRVVSRSGSASMFLLGSGPTMLRQVILENAVLLFPISSVLFIGIWRRERSDFFFWYSAAFALIAIGLIGWTGRFAQYLGFVFALNAILIARQTAAKKGLPLEEVIAGFFTDAEQSYTTLIETATDAIVVFDADDRVMVWNRAAENNGGFPRYPEFCVRLHRCVWQDRTRGR
jgi:PAS domain-containing protein